MLQSLQARVDTKLGVELEPGQAGDITPDVTEGSTTPRDPSGRYQIVGELGRGGMGIVYRGRDQDLGREVAMKVLKDEYAARSEVLARFVEEAQIGGQLQHPGIVPVYELGLQAGERPYFAMKLVKGETLSAQLARRNTLGEDRRRFLGVFEQVCQTMAYAHSRRVVHRDLKPANVMIGAFGEVQVVDWGMAKVLQKAVDGDAGDDAKPAEPRSVIETIRSDADSGLHSVAGSLFGTLTYMPPEQAHGDIARIDERSDVFALGAVLCEILTGHPPYRPQDGDLIEQAANAEVAGAHQRLRACGADAALVDLAIECLSPSRRARPPSAAVLAQRITAHLTSVEERARAAEIRAAEARLRNKVTILSSVAGLVLLAVGAAIWIHGKNLDQQRRTAAAQRVASANSAASEARGRAQSAGFDAALWSAAVTSAEQLASLAAGEDVDGKARDEARSLLAAVTAEADAARVESDRRARDQAMLARLELARIPADEDMRKDPTRELRRLDGAYAAAFDSYLGGASLFAPLAAVPLASLRRGDIEVELAGSLDHWGLVRDALIKGPDAPTLAGTARIREIAALLDSGDAWRTRLRTLLPDAAGERARLRELADHADFAVLTAVGCRVLSHALSSAGEKEAAITVLRRSLEAHPRDFDLCFQLGLALEVGDDAARLAAIDVYRIAYAIRPEQNEVVHRQMLTLKRLGRHVDEERLARLLLARSPRDPHWANHVGMALIDQRRFDEAIESLRLSLELDPDNAMVHGDLGSALASLGRHGEAIEAYREAVDIDPEYRLGQANLGLLLAQQGQIEEAIEVLRRALELDPGHQAVQRTLGWALLQQGDVDAAMPSLRRAVELDPEDPHAHLQLGIARLRKGDADDAIASLRRSIELDPRLPQTHLHLATALELRGQLPEALASCREMLRLLGDRQDPYAVDWRARAGQLIEKMEGGADRDLHLLAVARGEREPKDANEATAAAYLSYQRGEHELALRAYTRALQRFPELLTVLPHRYNAVCSAVLVATSHREGVAPATEAERAALRNQARAWLADEVAQWTEDLDGRSDERRQAAAKMFAHSLADADLAALRDEDSLSDLPNSEAEAWRNLWRKIRERGE